MLRDSNLVVGCISAEYVLGQFAQFVGVFDRDYEQVT